MKKLLTTTLFALCSTFLFGQSAVKLDSLKNEMLDSVLFPSDSNFLLSTNGLNLLFATKTAKYFGSAGDMTLYNNYFFGNVADGTLSFGKNFPLAKTNSGRTNKLVSFGIQGQAEDNFSTIYSNDGFAGQLGIDFKFSYICRGTIKYDSGMVIQTLDGNSLVIKSQVKAMRYERKKILGTVLQQMDDDTAEFMPSISQLSKGEQENEIELYEDGLSKKYWKAFTKAEAAIVEDSSYYRVAKIAWWSIGFHAPLTGKNYLIAPDLNDAFVEREDWQAYAEGSYSRVRDSKRIGLTLFTASVRFGNYNNIETEQLKSTTITKYQLLGGKDTITLSEVGKQSLYIGELKRFNVTTFQARLVHFFPGDAEWIGLSATFKYEIAEKKTMNLAFGIPLSLTGQEEDSKVNVELQFRIIDIADEIPDSGEREFNYQFGLNVGIPFGGVDL